MTRYQLQNNDDSIILVDSQTGSTINYTDNMPDYPYNNKGNLLNNKPISAAQFVAYSNDFTFYQKARFLSHLSESDAAYYLDIAHKQDQKS